MVHRLVSIVSIVTIVAATASFVGCVSPVTGDMSGGGGASETADASTGEGTNCGTDSTTGATLCLGLNLCPNVVINGSVYPECGFQVSGTAIDIECVCGAYLCPLGATPTCAAAASLLNELQRGCRLCGPGQRRLHHHCGYAIHRDVHFDEHAEHRHLRHDVQQPMRGGPYLHRLLRVLRRFADQITS